VLYHTQVPDRNEDPQTAAGTQPFKGIAFRLSSLGYTVSRGFGKALAPLQLEPSEFAVLRSVGFNEGRSQQALAEQLRISPSRMVAIVDELESRKLLERRPNPTDRRARSLYLTKDGQKLLERGFAVARAFEERVSGGLSDVEIDQFVDLLDRVAESLELAPGAHPALREPD
jgi:DNA-binding MarR family transcriptional regulator